MMINTHKKNNDAMLPFKFFLKGNFKFHHLKSSDASSQSGVHLDNKTVHPFSQAKLYILINISVSVRDFFSQVAVKFLQVLSLTN